jgi:hypothetical protein
VTRYRANLASFDSADVLDHRPQDTGSLSYGEVFPAPGRVVGRGPPVVDFGDEVSLHRYEHDRGSSALAFDVRLKARSAAGCVTVSLGELVALLVDSGLKYLSSGLYAANAPKPG